MLSQAQDFKKYLENRQRAIGSEKFYKSSPDLFNEKTFYRAFLHDMLEAKKEVIIYSPFVTKFRTDFFKQTIEKLRHRNIEIFIFTRPIEEYDSMLQPQIRCALKRYEELGVCVFYLNGFIHEKAAVIDREILWEGSLNILSQRASREIMRRTADENSALQIVSYLGLNEKLAEGYKLKYERLCRGLATDSKRVFKLKIGVFSLSLAMFIIVWWLFVDLKGMILLSQCIGSVINMIRLVSHN